MADQGTAPSPVPRTGRGIKIALAMSLGLNLLIVGLIAGAAMNRQVGPDRPPPSLVARGIGLGPYFTALPPDLQRALVQHVRQADQSEGRRPILRSMRTGFRSALDTLRSDPFDAEAFAAALAGQSGRLAERRTVSEAALTQTLSQMPPDVRAAYADALEMVVRRPFRRE